jgi:hypothetical protein
MIVSVKISFEVHVYKVLTLRTVYTRNVYLSCVIFIVIRNVPNFCCLTKKCFSCKHPFNFFQLPFRTWRKEKGQEDLRLCYDFHFSQIFTTFWQNVAH